MKRLLPLLLLLAGCDAVGPNYTPPQMPAPLPSAYPALAAADAPLSIPVAQSADLGQWWKQFNDAELESLVGRALSQNLDLLTAQSRIREARQQEIIAGAKGLPQVNASGNAAHLHSGNNFLSTLGGGGAGGGSGAPPASGGTDISLYSVGFDASWEIDVFGQVRRSVEAADAGTEAARWQMRDGEVSLTAEIAADYVMLRATQARLAILAAEEKSEREILDLVTARARAGFVTELDINQQQQLLVATIAQRPPLVAEIAAQRHAIAVLLGQEPGALDGELAADAPLPPVPPRLPIGLPADLLRARPDIRIAERKLAQATAQVGVATADLYPKFDLLAAINSSSNSLGSLFNSSSLGEIGLGSIMLPVFHGGQIHANIAAKDEERQQAYLAWQKSVLGGIRDVDDALVRYATEQQRAVTLDAAVKTAQQSTALALAQYRHGLVTYTSVLQAQDTEQKAQDSLAQSRAAMTGNLVSLFKALGGGWREEAAEPVAKERQIFRQ